MMCWGNRHVFSDDGTTDTALDWLSRRCECQLYSGRDALVVMLAKPSAAGGRVSVNSHPRGSLGAMCQQPT